MGRLTTGRICLQDLVSLSELLATLTEASDSLKLRDRNSSASVILSDEGAQGPQLSS